MTQQDEYGWQVWWGKIYATWERRDDGSLLFAPAADLTGWNGSPVEEGEDGLEVQVGRCERWLLPFDEYGQGLGGPASPDELLEAGDEILQSLSDVVCPLVGEEEMLTDDAYAVTETPIIDRLLVLAETELLPETRGHGIGAWASARSIDLLAGVSDSTLIATKAAPLHRRDFLPPGEQDRELNPAEKRQWDAAQRRISAHWQRTLGLVPYAPQKTLLIGTGLSTASARRALREAWAPDEW